MDSDGDGIGDNSDPEPMGISTITTGSIPNFVCIDPPDAPAAFVGTFTGTLDANYNIGNSAGCGGLGTGNGYSISFTVPDPGDTAGGDATFMVNVEGGGPIPSVVENAAASATISLTVTDTRGGTFESDSCSITITEVSVLAGQAGGELFFVDGNVTCDPLTIFSPSIGDQQPITFANPLVFRGAVGVVVF